MLGKPNNSSQLYGRFIKDFASFASPLSIILLRKIKILMNQPLQEAFDCLKFCLVSVPILALPD